ncbi:uncharacterized protein LOC125210561 [Salvia hispanica]|uniref:uncharacterized protein LOC125210561 n=1 Tax=Salvia hispanica TaxID=49212 RepID=UPI002009463F|nr:uncharacterized protein LOC125210561 [Salvia hispanica]
MGYYLADGIYPKWPIFVKTISCPTEEKRSYFAQRQEAARKRVERAFGVLQSRFALVKGPTRFFYKGDITDIIYAAIVLHNMIVESKDEDVADVPVEDIAGSSHGVARESHRQGVPHGFADCLWVFVDMRQKEVHNRLQHDMIEEIWGQRGGH